MRTIPDWMYDDLYRLGGMTRDEVRALWDQYDGCNSPGGISGEAMHAHLNALGDGEYCAV
jgi:hypothetical protein